MRSNTRRALALAAAEQGYEIEISIQEHDQVEIELIAADWEDENESRYVARRLQAHRLANGRWINAQWSHQHGQWQSRDITRRTARYNTNTCYVFSRNLHPLAGNCYTYRTAGQAILSVIRDLGAGA